MRHFDLCVIGSGSGNALVDRRFRDADVALVDDNPVFGGTCLNRGCIPTKMFVHPADLVRDAADAGPLGVSLDGVTVDWPAVRDRIFGRIDPLAHAGERHRETAPHVTLFRDTGTFVAPRTLRVGDETITADAVVLAAGSRPRRPDVPGVADPALADRVHTSDTIMRLAELPASLVIVGSGFVAAEFAHVFASFGTDVTVVSRSPGVLSHEDVEVSRRYTTRLARRVTLRLGQELAGVRPGPGGALEVVTRDAGGVTHAFTGEHVLLATGRVPNSDRLAVAAAGIETDEDGYVVVDDHQRTSADGVWAIGDIAGRWQLKHVANHEMRVVQHNLLHPDALRRADHRFVPHAVFGDPHVAAVGLTEEQARSAGIDVAVTVREYGTVAYGWAMEDTDHCVKLVADRDTRRLVGAHVYGPEASVLLQPLVQAMSFGLEVPAMARGQYWIHPSLAEVVENALLDLGLGEDA